VKPIEQVKPIEKPKKEDIIETVKKPEKKTETLIEEKKESLKHLQEDLEEIRKKIALDEIKMKVAQKEQTRKEPVEEPPAPPLLPSPQVSSSKTSPELLTIYSGIVRARILDAWTIPENVLKEMVDLESTIVVIIDKEGNVQKQKLDKKSGNAIYDQSAMRAIKKAEPFPPIPKELGEDTLEFEMHFTPDLIR
jgi:colicin import membrane protein